MSDSMIVLPKIHQWRPSIDHWYAKMQDRWLCEQADKCYGQQRVELDTVSHESANKNIVVFKTSGVHLAEEHIVRKVANA